MQVAAADVPVIVKISADISRAVEYYNFSYSINDSYQKFTTTIYNTGSIGCLTRIRFDIFNSSNDALMYSAWSDEKAIEPGGFDNFESYWYPYNITGDFYSKMRIYQCNDIFVGPASNFSINNPVTNQTKKIDILDDKIMEIKNIENTENKLVLEIKAERDIKNMIINPAQYYPGWIFENKKINIKKGKTEIVSINYVPSIWRENKIIFHFFDEENNYFSRKEFYIRKNEKLNTKDVIIAILSVFAFILIFLHIRELKNKKKIDINF